MFSYLKASKEILKNEFSELQKLYNEFKSRNLSLDMSRGKPSPDQLDLSMDMLDDKSYIATNGLDCRNYGVLDGIPEAKKLFAELLEVSDKEIIVGGNSSLNLMYDTILRFMQFGASSECKPWNKCEKIKFICPVPGYDRHFAICNQLGIEMINVDMTENGPDMDAVEKLISEDESIKGIWCVPKYSNPQGITYSDETVKRMASLKPKATDFRIFWDNAYVVHHLSDDRDELLNIVDECKKNGTEDMVIIFASTSKITFSGSGVAVMASSEKNIGFFKSIMTMQTIGFDKLNQLRHVNYFKNMAGIEEHMKKHAAILKPKFDIVLNALSSELLPREIIKYTNPKGGYFVSVETLDDCAKRVVQLCKEAGVVLTGAGATYPYGRDPKDSNIRIAPTYPNIEELKLSIELFCICVRLASVEKLLSER